MPEDEQQRLARLKHNLERRAFIFQSTRTFFIERDFLEVETPIRVPTVAPEAQITPFQSEGWFLSTSPELYMKRLLASGYDRLFQISHCFRKGERGRWHNPEFTMLEWYRTGADYHQMIRDTEELVMANVNRLKLKPVISYQNQDIDLTLPWPRISVRDAFRSTAGWNPISQTDSVRFDIDLVTKVIPGLPLRRPIVLSEYPAAMASLARLKPDEPGVAERAEVFIGGLEIANAYSELKDNQEQQQRFQAEIAQIQQERGQTIAMPWQFLEAVTHLPECGGIALGMDRLVMLLCDAATIDEVIPFTTDTA
jgi:lysyl-tRNA synthetase class 2